RSRAAARAELYAATGSRRRAWWVSAPGRRIPARRPQLWTGRCVERQCRRGRPDGVGVAAAITLGVRGGWRPVVAAAAAPRLAGLAAAPANPGDYRHPGGSGPDRRGVH